MPSTNVHLSSVFTGILLCRCCSCCSTAAIGPCVKISQYPLNGTEPWMPDVVVRQEHSVYLRCYRPATVGQCFPKYAELLHWKYQSEILYDSRRSWIESSINRTFAGWRQGDASPEGDWHYLSTRADASDQGEYECAVKWGPEPEDVYTLRTFLTVVGTNGGRSTAVYLGNPLTLTCTDDSRLIDGSGRSKTVIESVVWCYSTFQNLAKRPTPTSLLMEYHLGVPQILTFHNGWAKRDVTVDPSSPLVIVLSNADAQVQHKTYRCAVRVPYLERAIFAQREVLVVDKAQVQ